LFVDESPKFVKAAIDTQLQPEPGSAMERRAREATTPPAGLNAGFWLCSLGVFTNKASCVFSTTAAIAVENPVVAITSRSNQSGESAFLLYSVKPPSSSPSRFIRLKVKLQFVSDVVSKQFQKN
jgi:hypothetical protein